MYYQITEQLTLVSLAADGTAANNSSRDPKLSSDGRFVIFQSAATNLIDLDANGSEDIFVLDRTTGQTRLVSSGFDDPLNYYFSTLSAISADGRYIVFTAFVEPSPEVPRATQLFRFDQTTRTTALISVTPSGEIVNDQSLFGVMSADGLHIAYVSVASNLVENDTNDTSDVFVMEFAG